MKQKLVVNFTDGRSLEVISIGINGDQLNITDGVRLSLGVHMDTVAGIVYMQEEEPAGVPA